LRRWRGCYIRESEHTIDKIAISTAHGIISYQHNKLSSLAKHKAISKGRPHVSKKKGKKDILFFVFSSIFIIYMYTI
jgi:hypothetical protein